MYRIFTIFASLFTVLSTPGWADMTYVPDRRVTVSSDVDYIGTDLRQLFDITYAGCERACLEDESCVAFTYNSRSNACFPKSAVGSEEQFTGAFSARVLTADPAIVAASEDRAAELDFLTRSDLEAAVKQARSLGSFNLTNGYSAEEWLNSARRARAGGNIERAINQTAAALTLTDAADQWVELAQHNLDMSPAKNAEKRNFRRAALSSAINGYLRTASPATRTSALIVMATALEDLGRGRVMISALRLAQELQPRDDTQIMLDDAIGKYGFRVVETTVESDAAAPRICAVFSDNLITRGTDYTPFVQLPEAGLSVDVTARKLCVSGVRHGERYRISLRQGLPAADGETLAKTVALTQYVRDRSPAVRFPGRAYVLPRTADAGIPVITVNLTELDLTLRRVSDRNIVRSMQENFFGRPLDMYEDELFEAEIAEVVWTGTGKVRQEINRDMTTRLPMGDVVAGLPAGIYALRASVPGVDEDDTLPATQWFVISDIGTTSYSGVDGLHVFARSLNTATAKPGVEVELISNANAVLGRAVTDEQGYARFAPGLIRGTGATAPALLTLRQGEDDIAFLSLRDAEFDLSDRGVEGRPPAPPVDVFLTTDRGAYRAGETVFATALTRDEKAMAITGLPVTAVLNRPDGVEYSRHISVDDLAGGHVFELPIAGNAPRGTWSLAVYADVDAAPLATSRFLVEDFLPERIDFDMALAGEVVIPNQFAELSIDARYLFGTPAAGLPLEGEVRLSPKSTLEEFPGYRFGRADQFFSSVSNGMFNDDGTDPEGRAEIGVLVPAIAEVDRPMAAEFVMRLSEGSGRPVERRIDFPVAPVSEIIGIRPDFEGTLPEGTEAGFSVIALNPDLDRTEMQVDYVVNRIERRYQWYSLYGNWNWDVSTTRTRVANGTAAIPAGEPLEIRVPVDWGNYEILIERTDGTYAAASREFSAGWFATADSSATPDMLELSLDKEVYAAGETARLRLLPRYDGTALITVMSNRLIDMKAVPVVAGENLVDLDVTEAWGAGAYVTAQVVRPMDVPAGRNPSRSIGLSYAGIDPAPKLLTARFDTPAEAAPRQSLVVPLSVEGITKGKPAYATIAAIDVGILNLTGFDSPDPAEHYFGQRKLGMGIRDIYGRLIDGLNGAMGQVRSGGDLSPGLGTQAPPPTEELVAYFSGPVAVDEDGIATAEFDLPEFNGTVRLMAVVWSDGRIGQAEAEVLVRDPVVMTASLPRFMAPGDRSVLRLQLNHATGPAGRVGLDLVASDGLSLDSSGIPSGLDLPTEGSAELLIPLTADDTGLQSLEIALTTPGGSVLTKTLSLPVGFNDPETVRTSRLELAAGAATDAG